MQLFRGFCEFQAVSFEILGHKWLKWCRISSSFETQANFDLFFSSPQRRIKVIMFLCNNQHRIKHLIFMLFFRFSSRMSNPFFLNFYVQCFFVTVCISVCVCAFLNNTLTLRKTHQRLLERKVKLSMNCLWLALKAHILAILLINFFLFFLG